MAKDEESSIDMTIIDKVLATSESQKDRTDEVDNTRDLNLVKLLNNQIERASSKYTLKDSVISKIKDRIADETEGNEITTSALIHLLEILDRGDNDLMISIISASKDHAFLQTLKNKNDGVNFSKEDMELFKKVVSAISYIETVAKAEGEE